MEQMFRKGGPAFPASLHQYFKHQDTKNLIYEDVLFQVEEEPEEEPEEQAEDDSEAKEEVVDDDDEDETVRPFSQ